MKTNKTEASARRVRAPRKTTAAGAEKKRGNIFRSEIQPLVMAARQAFDMQQKYGNIDQDVKFDAWRHEQVMAVVGKPGLTACSHHDFRPLLAHFQTLSGNIDKAFATHMRSGKQRSSDAPGDTREARDQMVHLIKEEIRFHLYLGNTSLEQIEADTREACAKAEMAFPGLSERTISTKHAIEANGGPINDGYLLAIARNKFRKPQLQMSQLAERLTVKELTDLLSTVRNRISTREGRAVPSRRKKETRRRTDEPF